MARLDRDGPRLAERFGAGLDPGRLVAISPAGDPHQGHRRVCVLRFATGRQLVYKPRPVGSEAAWHRLVTWLNVRAGAAVLAAPAVLDRGDYGWVEHLSDGQSGRRAVGPVYYRRSGILLALLDVLEVRDATIQNVVVWCGYPVLVDAETIAHPRLAPYVDSPSLALTGFLPGPGDPARRAGIHAARHRKAPHPARYAKEIVAGYRLGYELLGRHRRTLLARSGPLAELRKLRVRVLLRPTRVYARGPWPPTGLPELLLPRAVTRVVLAHERVAVSAGDIPVFRARAGGRMLIPGGTAFRRSGVGAISRRLARLSRAEREEMVTIIRGALTLDALARS